MSRRPIEAAGRKVDVFESGSGPDLVYLHGFADLHGVKADPFPFHQALAHNRRVIAPAHPGCADSDEYEDLSTVEDAVYHTLEVLDALEVGRFDLVGHCMGGWIAAELAVRHPRRVASLTLIGASGLFVPGAPIGDVFMMAQPARGVDYAGLRRMLFAADDTPLGCELFPDGRGNVDDEVRRYQMLRFASFIGFKPPYFYSRPLINRLHRVTCPALMIWGEMDGFVPRQHGEAYAEGLSGSNGLEIVAGAGHAAHLESPDEVAGLVTAFLP